MAGLFLPILIPVLSGCAALYPWADPSAPLRDELLRHNGVYLEPTFFGFRAFAYLAIWLFFTRFFLMRSLKQDRTGDMSETLRMERWSPAAMLLFAVTVTFAAIDWLMSLTPDWYSTIFGVYFFAGIAVSGLSMLILACIFLQATGRLASVITAEHYHDLGKLLLTFVVFWGYIAFSQYLLIWYGNMPEETRWYLVRQSGGWKWIAAHPLGRQLFDSLLRAVAQDRQAAKNAPGSLGLVAAGHALDRFILDYHAKPWRR